MLLPFNKFQFILLTEVSKHKNEEIKWFGFWAHETPNRTPFRLNWMKRKPFEVFDSGHEMKWNHFVYCIWWVCRQWWWSCHYINDVRIALIAKSRLKTFISVKCDVLNHHSIRFRLKLFANHSTVQTLFNFCLCPFAQLLWNHKSLCSSLQNVLQISWQIEWMVFEWFVLCISGRVGWQAPVIMPLQNCNYVFVWQINAQTLK